MPVRFLGHAVLKVRNRGRAEAFYHDVLGLPVAARSDELRMTFFTLGRHHDLAVLEVGEDAPGADPKGVGLFHVAFNVGDTLDDAWIHTKIVAKLIANSKTPERKINVDVVKNVVTLRGTVDTAEEKTAAEKVAKDTDGVKSVVNQLKVAPPPKSSPAKTATPKTTKSY